MINLIGRVMSIYWVKVEKSKHHRKVGLKTDTDPETQSTVFH